MPLDGYFTAIVKLQVVPSENIFSINEIENSNTL